MRPVGYLSAPDQQARKASLALASILSRTLFFKMLKLQFLMDTKKTYRSLQMFHWIVLHSSSNWQQSSKSYNLYWLSNQSVLLLSPRKDQREISGRVLFPSKINK